MLQPFLDANKAVFHVEYTDSSTAAGACTNSNRPSAFSTLILSVDLDDSEWRACP
jgi:hypothetical protein